MTTLSVTVIAKNESENIGICLESVKWADEVIVLDSGSLDNTVEICRQYTDKVFITDWQGFGIQKNRAIDMATSEWILSIDADEFVSCDLKIEIEKVINKKNNNLIAYKIPRSSNYCGRFMKHSGWSPDYVTRLFRRGYARFSDDLVHESLIVQNDERKDGRPSEVGERKINGRIGRLTTPLIHNSFKELDKVLEKVNAYSSASAKMLYQRGKKASITDAVLHGLWSFFYTYILRAGFLDGKEGFMLAVSSAEVTYYKYAKLMLLINTK
ncbi:MAG: glycosyltransferase family 2 protein [Desulfamplus sp.]|nr:glycosyltransferase family 2 protein [Desulfamplus sp.]